MTATKKRLKRKEKAVWKIRRTATPQMTTITIIMLIMIVVLMTWGIVLMTHNHKIRQLEDKYERFDNMNLSVWEMYLKAQKFETWYRRMYEEDDLK